MTTSKTIVAFHIGRGGHFHNPGHLSFLAERGIRCFTDNIFLRHENEYVFKDRYGYDDTHKGQRCILDLITDMDYEYLEEQFGITLEMLGERAYFSSNGSPVGLTEREADLGVGCIDIDGDYDTTYCLYLEDCSEKELQLIIDCSWAPNYLIEAAVSLLNITEII